MTLLTETQKATSILEQFEDEVSTCTKDTWKDLRDRIVITIDNSSILSKDSLMKNFLSVQSWLSFITLFYNALLAKEGMRTTVKPRY
jgi:hypothetical protein